MVFDIAQFCILDLFSSFRPLLYPPLLSSSSPSILIAATTWSTDSSNRTSSWLVLRNLTPQIDGSTLRTLCMQHGPLITFHLNLTQGNALVRYSSKEEAAKAQKSLHMYGDVVGSFPAPLTARRQKHLCHVNCQV